MPWAAIIPAVASVAGSVIGGVMSSNSARENTQMNIDMQREFAQNALSWKVADAQRAGIHPLFGLGAQTHAFSPVQVGTPDYASTFGKAGQDLGRAAVSLMDNKKRDNFVSQSSVLALENQALQNDLLRSQIARLNGQIPPPFPSGVGTGGLAGQNVAAVAGGNLGAHKIEPAEITANNPAAVSQTAGPSIPTVTWGTTSDNRGVQAFPPKSLGVEDEFGAPLMFDWYLRNRILPNVDSSGKAPSEALLQKMYPGAIRWQWSHMNQRWEPDFGSRGPRFIGGAVGRPPGIRDALRAMQFNRYQYR